MRGPLKICISQHYFYLVLLEANSSDIELQFPEKCADLGSKLHTPSGQISHRAQFPKCADRELNPDLKLGKLTCEPLYYPRILINKQTSFYILLISF